MLKTARWVKKEKEPNGIHAGHPPRRVKLERQWFLCRNFVHKEFPQIIAASFFLSVDEKSFAQICIWSLSRIGCPQSQAFPAFNIGGVEISQVPWSNFT